MMSKNSQLILITNTFPYGPGEQFLETEIVYLAKTFKKVMIIPMKITGHNRQVPENVEVFIAHKKKSHTKTKAFILSIFSIIFWQEIIEKPKILVRLSSLKLLIGTIGLAKNVFKIINSKVADGSITINNAVVYSYWLRPSAVLAIFLSKKYKTNKNISRAHGGDLYENRRKDGYLALRKYIFKNTDLICTVSENGAKYLKEKHNLPDNKILLSRLGVKDLGFKTKTNKIRDSFNLVSCSFLNPVKRIDLIIGALDKFSRSNPHVNVTWNHLGGGWDEERLVNIANTLPNQVSFKFWGSLKNSEVIDFYMKNTIDLFINVSSSEGIPVSMMEAQNCGIVIAGTNVGGVSEIVNDENGFLLSADPTLDEITFVFKNAYNNKREMEAKKINSWANWQCHYSAEKNYIEFINGVLLKT